MTRIAERTCLCSRGKLCDWDADDAKHVAYAGCLEGTCHHAVAVDAVAASLWLGLRLLLACVHPSR